MNDEIISNSILTNDSEVRQARSLFSEQELFLSLNTGRQARRYDPLASQDHADHVDKGKQRKPIIELFDGLCEGPQSVRDALAKSTGAEGDSLSNKTTDVSKFVSELCRAKILIWLERRSKGPKRSGGHMYSLPEHATDEEKRISFERYPPERKVPSKSKEANTDQQPLFGNIEEAQRPFVASNEAVWRQGVDADRRTPIDRRVKHFAGG